MMDEGHDKFMDRCMKDTTMMQDYEDEQDRKEACQMQWNKNEKKSNDQGGEVMDSLLASDGRALWTTAYINDLSDSSFLYIAPGGKKDDDGKTVPRSLRYFPYKDKGGKVDLPHLRNALSRIPQSNLSQDIKDKLMAKARKILADATGGADGQSRKIIGYGSIFNSPANIGWFDEEVAPGCFSDSIADDDIRCLFNHDPNLILGRNKANTLVLREDARGLYYENMVPDTTVGRDTVTSIQRGDVTGCSFSFQTLKDAWDRTNPDHPKRTLIKARVFDVGPVTFPAYPDTTVAARSLESDRAAEKSREPPGPEKPPESVPTPRRDQLKKQIRIASLEP